jgi:hypothetical protein
VSEESKELLATSNLRVAFTFGHEAEGSDAYGELASALRAEARGI